VLRFFAALWFAFLAAVCLLVLFVLFLFCVGCAPLSTTGGGGEVVPILAGGVPAGWVQHKQLHDQVHDQLHELLYLLPKRRPVQCEQQSCCPPIGAHATFCFTSAMVAIRRFIKNLSWCLLLSSLGMSSAKYLSHTPSNTGENYPEYSRNHLLRSTLHSRDFFFFPVFFWTSKGQNMLFTTSASQRPLWFRFREECSRCLHLAVQTRKQEP